MYIQPDEHIIIMDMNGGNVFHGNARVPSHLLPLDDLKQLRDIGIKTTYYQGAIRWDQMQPIPVAEIDFFSLDEYVRKMEYVGLKTIVPFLDSLPQWKPDNWYLRRDWYGVPDYRNKQTEIDFDEFAKKIISRYDSKYFQLIYAVPACGEFPVHYHAYGSRLTIVGTNEVLPTKVLSDWFIGRQKILEAQHGELWSAYHHYAKPKWFAELHNDVRKEFPDSPFYSIHFTYFEPLKHRPGIRPSLQWARDTWNMKYFIGSEYCQGLREHTPIALEDGVWGFITAPISWLQPYHFTEPWMFEELKWSMQQFREHYG